VLLELDRERDDGEPEQREDEGKHHRALEDLVREVHEVGVDAEAAEDHEDAAARERAQRDEEQAEAALVLRPRRHDPENAVPH